MSRPDLNLLYTLDVLLAEGNVARAARRLHLSSSAMSRALARLREATGDPLLVRAGRGLVASPRALELRESIGRLVHDAEAVLRPAGKLRLEELDRTFTVRASEGFVENFGAGLLAAIARQAPRVRLHFLHKLDKDSGPLRDGTVDLETGVVDAAISPEVRAQALFRDRHVAVVRKGHPLAKGKMPGRSAPLTASRLVGRRSESKRDNRPAVTGTVTRGMQRWCTPTPTPGRRCRWPPGATPATRCSCGRRSSARRGSRTRRCRTIGGRSRSMCRRAG